MQVIPVIPKFSSQMKHNHHRTCPASIRKIAKIFPVRQRVDSIAPKINASKKENRIIVSMRSSIAFTVWTTQL
jgi:hypothetical protein